MIELNKIYNEECLEGMKQIPDGSVDMILCDLPYGTTAVACLNTERNFIGFELNEEYYNMSLKRISENE
ncbi:DNA methylase [Lactococcus phage 936 group phage PhiL.6]|uniref:DNA methylase n=1 Tax=Lactococcus phage 936 group phage PhiL.6 TaxID=1636582 RepID=A0A126HBT2_9CAUD|nr:DNA methylase [Lactococcus phage 936 group phage PhiL.6]ALM64058.1 DNA methylase [Lactococcus phage 936 group phage PhiL.6]